MIAMGAEGIAMGAEGCANGAMRAEVGMIDMNAEGITLGADGIYITENKCRCPCNARFRGRSLVYDCYMMWLQKNLKNCAYFNI